MSTDDGDMTDDQLPGHPVYPEAGREPYYGHGEHPFASLKPRECANRSASVAGIDDGAPDDPDEVVPLGRFNPAYLRQWAELVEFAYGRYDSAGKPRGAVSLQLRKNNERWGLAALPEHDASGGVYPIVFNRLYPDSYTALPPEDER